MMDKLIVILILFGGLLSTVFSVDIFITYIAFTFNFLEDIHDTIREFNKVLVALYLAWIVILFLMVIVVVIKEFVNENERG